MSKTWTIFKRELGEYFYSPVAYAAIVVLLFYMGWKGLNTILEASTPQANMRPFFSLTPWVLCFVGPALTMHLLSEERGRGTLQLLLSLPVSDWAVVLGKYLAALAVLLAALAVSLVYPIVVNMYGNLDWGVTIGGYLGLVLMGACTLAIGLMTSSWTKSQFLAFIVGTFACLMLWELGNPETLTWVSSTANGFLELFGIHSRSAGETVSSFVQYLALGSHMENISKGVLDTRDMIYYVSMIGAGVTLSALSLESRKWR